MNVPDGWRVATLGEVTRKPQKVDPGSTGRTSVHYVDIGLLDGPAGYLGDAPEIPASSAPSRCRQIIQSGDTLYSTVRPYLRKIALVGDSLDGEFASTGYAVLRPTDDVDPRYVYLFTQSRQFEDSLFPLQKGVSYPAVLDKEVRSRSIWFPELAEQRRIVEMVEEHLAHLDAADASLAQAEQRLIALQEGVIRFAVSGGGEERVVSPDTLSRAGTADGELPHLPRGWSWARLGDIADVVGGVTKDSKKQADPTYVAAPYLRVANVQRGHLNLDSVTTIRVPPKRLEALRLQPGDVLLNEGGDRDKLARGWVWDGQIDDCIHQNHVFRARIRDNLIDARFLSHTANALGGKWADRNGKQTTNLASISLSMIRKMPVIIPPANTSNQIADHLADRLDNLDRQRTAIRAQQHRSTVLRRAVLAAAFAGRLSGAASDSGTIEEMAS